MVTQLVTAAATAAMVFELCTHMCDMCYCAECLDCKELYAMGYTLRCMTQLDSVLAETMSKSLSCIAELVNLSYVAESENRGIDRFYTLIIGAR